MRRHIDGCARSQAMITGTHAVTSIEGSQVRLDGAQVDVLERRIAGRIITEGQPGWDDAVLIWNAMWPARPALVAQPRSARDVAAIVSFARENGLLVSIKGGGHNIAGTAIAEGGLMIDMAAMRDVVVDPAARLVHAGGGCLLGDVDRATQQYGLATVLGLVSDVGVAGLTLGGGFGNLARRFGWAVDNLESVEVVTADGQIRVASANEHPDLFWAIRGGGGNYGVVTRFTFRLHDVGPNVFGGMLVWGVDRGRDVFDAYRDVTDRGPRELMTGMIVSTAPPAPFVPVEWHGKRIVAVPVCHSGRNPEQDIGPLRRIGSPVADLLAIRPYVEQQTLLNDMEPKGFNQYWKTGYLAALADGFSDAFLDAGLTTLSPHSYAITLQLGGAIADRDPDDGAVGNRDACFVSGVSAMWENDGRDSEHIGWARDSWNRMMPFSTGGNYVNFQMPDDDASRTAAAYGSNFDRLRQIKTTYDPGNFFRINRNISPAS
jgi:FAD/FMN-containing dehydrogenase